MKEQRGKFWKQSKINAVNKELEKLIEKMKKNVIMVEGKRDAEALKNMGICNVYAVVGREESVLNKVKDEKEVILLMDLDRKGHALAERMQEKLWSMGIKSDVLTRRKLGRILKVKYFENLNKKYEKYIKGE